MRGGRRRLVYALLLAAGLHLDLLLLLGYMLHGAGPGARHLKGQAEEETIGIDTVDPETARELLAELDRTAEAAEKKAEEEAEKQAEKERESLQAPGQVVDLPPPPTPSDRPRDAKYVAEHDNKVDKEMKRQGRFDDKPMTPPLLAMRTPAERATSPGTSSPPPAETRSARRGRTPTPPAPEAAQPVPADPDGIHALEPGLPREDRDDPAVDPATGSPGKHRPGSMPLLPNSLQLARAVGAGTQDHLPDVDDGATTSLNAKGWKFASFFNRIKRQVAQHWHPADQYEKRDPTGHIYGAGQWVTFLRIQLKPDGSLSGVSIEKPSGLEFLDDEAVEAIKRGSPYPNPPSQLIGDGGVIAFKFGFFFDVDGGPRMKVYRYSGL